MLKQLPLLTQVANLSKDIPWYITLYPTNEAVSSVWYIGNHYGYADRELYSHTDRIGMDYVTAKLVIAELVAAGTSVSRPGFVDAYVWSTTTAPYIVPRHCYSGRRTIAGLTYYGSSSNIEAVSPKYLLYINGIMYLGNKADVEHHCSMTQLIKKHHA